MLWWPAGFDGEDIAVARKSPLVKTRASQTFSYSSSWRFRIQDRFVGRVPTPQNVRAILVSRFLELRAGKTGLPPGFLCAVDA